MKARERWARPSASTLLLYLVALCLAQQALVYIYHHFDFFSGGAAGLDLLHAIDASKHAPFHNRPERRAETPRVAVLIPYTGPALPNWFDLWLHTAATSAPLFDFLLLVTEAPLRLTPPNVRMIRLPPGQLVDRILALDPGDGQGANGEGGEGEERGQRADNPRLAVEMLLQRQAYSVVELKPALGFLFAAHVPRETYSHWAFADMDQLMGRLHTHVPAAALQHFDVVTLAFGDNYRMYARGQLTIHRLDPFVTQLWRECVHLSSFGARLGAWERGGYEKWTFVSAEGCYSRVIADHAVYSIANENTNANANGNANGVKTALLRGSVINNAAAAKAGNVAVNGSAVTLLVLASQLTDAFNAPLDEKETILLAGAHINADASAGASADANANIANAGSLWRCYGHSLSHAVAAAPLPLPLTLTDTLTQAPGSSAGITGTGTGTGVGRGFSELTLKDYRCAYWVAPAFQVCLSTVPPYADLQAVGGRIQYRDVDRYLATTGQTGNHLGVRGNAAAASQGEARAITDSQVDSADGADNTRRLGAAGVGCRQGSISHFQGWKRNYYSFTSRTPGPDVHAAVLSERGIVPLTLGADYSSFASLWGQPAWSSRISAKDVMEAAASTNANAAAAAEPAVIRRGKLISRLTGSANAGAPSPGPGSLFTGYCLAHGDDLRACLCFAGAADVEVVQRGNPDTHVGSYIALVMVAWADDFYSAGNTATAGTAGAASIKRSSPIFKALSAWRGEAVLVTARLEHDAYAQATTNANANGNTLIPGLEHVTLIDVHVGACVEHTNTLPEGPILPDAVLYNIALDVSMSSSVLVMPAGMVPAVVGSDGVRSGNSAAASDGKDAAVTQGKVDVAAVLGQMLQAAQGVKGSADTRPVALLLPPYALAHAPDDDREHRELSIIGLGLGLGAFGASARGDGSAEAVADALDANADADANTNGLAAGASYTSYPPPSNTCGPRQSPHLRYSSPRLLALLNANANAIANTPATTSAYPTVPFNAQDFTHSSTLLTPVLFPRSFTTSADAGATTTASTVSASPHGREFVRFVAELSGPGCFGSSFARVLVGSGYVLKWADAGVGLDSEAGAASGGGAGAVSGLAVVALIDEREASRGAGSGGGSDGGASYGAPEAAAAAEGAAEGGAETNRSGRTSQDDPLTLTRTLPAHSSQATCGCAFSQDPNSHRTLVNHLNRYFHRIVAMRAKGGVSVSGGGGESDLGSANAEASNFGNEAAAAGAGEQEAVGSEQDAQSVRQALASAASPRTVNLLRGVYSRKPFGGLFVEEQRNLLSE